MGGLPILIEVSMPSVISTEGYVTVECSKTLPSIELSLTNKISTALTGYVGTVCPFTKEVIATGINKEWSVNYPTKMLASVESGKLKVVSKLTEETKSAPEVDLISFTIKPFAVIKPVVAIDLIPLPVHPSVKIIKSEGERRTIEHTFGEAVGLTLKSLIKTEAEVTDLRSVVDFYSLYKYNPLNSLLFGWTASPMTVGGYPTTRYSEYKIIYLPTRSATKEMETEVALGAVYKKHSYIIEYKPESLEVIAPKQVLEKTERTKICIDGKLTMPSVSLRNTHELKSQDIKMFLKNVIGFGKTCEEYSVKIDGSSLVSYEQKELATRSIS